MATATLSATPRTTTGKGAARSLRAAGQVPAVIYGHARQAQSLVLDARTLDKLLSQISAENTVVELSFDGATTRTLIREIQRHPVKRRILHVDFQELVAGEKVMVRIPLVLVGMSEGVRLGGGIIDQILRELQIRVDPANIPNHLDVDISALQLGHSVHVRELKLPEGVEVLEDEDATICVISVPRAAIEAVAAEGTEGAEPELIRKAKEDEDAEADKK